MFKIQKISLKIPRFLASIKNVQELVSLDLFCYLTVVGLELIEACALQFAVIPSTFCCSDQLLP